MHSDAWRKVYQLIGLEAQRNALEVLRRGLERRGYPEIDKFDSMGRDP